MGFAVNFGFCFGGWVCFGLGVVEFGCGLPVFLGALSGFLRFRGSLVTDRG